MEDGVPEFLSNEEVQRVFAGGPQLNRGWVLVLIGERIYRREDGRWRLLANKPMEPVAARGS